VLTRFAGNQRIKIEIDSNVFERLIRPFALNQKPPIRGRGKAGPNFGPCIADTAVHGFLRLSRPRHHPDC
jgi:hypothetical protein